MSRTDTHPEASIELTAAAAAVVLSRAGQEGCPGAPLRVKIRGGGCSGVTYHMSYEPDGPAETDYVKTEHGATIVIDPRSMVYLKGSTLDYHKDLMSQRFVWSNPNAKNSCGCGQSFAV